MCNISNVKSTLIVTIIILPERDNGELCLIVHKTFLLSPCLHPIPHKDELKQKGKHYRQRYLDLIVNDSASKKFRTRTKIVSFIRRFLDGKGN